MEEVMNLSYSKLKVFRRCGQEFHYKYVEKIEAKRKGVALWRGTVLHEALQARAMGLPWQKPVDDAIAQFGKLWEEEKDRFGDLPRDLTVLMRGYHDKWQADGLKYRMVEQEMWFWLIPNRVKFVFKPDGICEDEKGRLWLVEHKSHKKLPTEAIRVFNLQTLLYIYGLAQNGIKVDGVMWDYIRTKAPRKPKMLKTRLEMKSNMDTTIAVYRETVKELGLDWKAYKEWAKEHLTGKEDTFYRRVFLPVRHKMLDQVVREAAISAHTMLAGLPPTRAMDNECERCDFYSLCYAELAGLDSNFIRKADFQPRKRREEAPVVEESDDDEDDEAGDDD